MPPTENGTNLNVCFSKSKAALTLQLDFYEELR